MRICSGAILLTADEAWYEVFIAFEDVINKETLHVVTNIVMKKCELIEENGLFISVLILPLRLNSKVVMSFLHNMGPDALNPRVIKVDVGLPAKLVSR